MALVDCPSRRDMVAQAGFQPAAQVPARRGKQIWDRDLAQRQSGEGGREAKIGFIVGDNRLQYSHRIAPSSRWRRILSPRRLGEPPASCGPSTTYPEQPSPGLCEASLALADWCLHLPSCAHPPTRRGRAWDWGAAPCHGGHIVLGRNERDGDDAGRSGAGIAPPGEFVIYAIQGSRRRQLRSAIPSVAEGRRAK